jgi:hypothetical protein
MLNYGIEELWVRIAFINIFTISVTVHSYLVTIALPEHHATTVTIK